MTRLDELKSNFNKLYDLKKKDRMLFLVAMLTEYFSEDDIRPVIVGGLSVEIYTRNNYTTYDIDLIMDGRDKLDALLVNELSFEKMGRSWYHKGLEISIEVPSNHLEGSYGKIFKLILPNKQVVFVIGLEDIIIHRLESAVVTSEKHPENTEDYLWAKSMFETHAPFEGMINAEYLVNTSLDTSVNDILKKWLENLDI